MNTGLQRAIKAAGNAATLAKMLGISQSAVSQWKGKPPLLKCPAIEKATGISCRDLRPDFFRRVAK